MKLIKLLILILLYLPSNSKSSEVTTLVTIDNQTITNIDLANEIKTIEIMKNIKLTSSESSLVLNNMINEKIKYIETQNKAIEFNKNEVANNYNAIINKNLDIDPEIKKNIQDKLIVTSKWNNLVLKKFRGKLDINSSEIDQIIKDKKLNEMERDKIIIREKNKKLNVLSKTFFNEVKKKYLIKRF